MVNRKIIDGLFMLLVFALPFKFIPSALWQTLIGGFFAPDLIIYPLIAGALYTGYSRYKYGNVFLGRKIFGKFLLGYMAAVSVAVVWGLIVYPYAEMIINGPITQSTKLTVVLGVLSQLGISVDEKAALKLLMVYRPLKGILLDTFWTFGGAYMIFCWYHDRPRRMLEILGNVVMVSLVLVALYGAADMAYQSGCRWAEDFLARANPILHSIGEGTDWSPRLFWGMQNRSLFLEPSYFGIYMSFALPLLWWKLYDAAGACKIAVAGLMILLMTELFLTNARTTMALILGEAVVLFVLSLLRMDRKLWLHVGAVAVCMVISFGGALYFMGHYQVPAAYGDPTPMSVKIAQLEKIRIEKEKAEAIRREKAEKEARAKAEAAANVEKAKKAGSEEASPADKKQTQSAPAAPKAEKVQKPPVSGAQQKADVNTYLDNTVLSLVDSEKGKMHAGSNHTRFTVIKTNLSIGMEHPILGVGPTLRTAYLYDKLKEDPGAELQKFNRLIRERGILHSGYPDLGDYAGRFAETGVIGIGLFLFPPIIILWRVGREIVSKKYHTEELIPILFLCISFLGMLASGLGDSINITYCYWCLLGSMYAVYYGIFVKNRRETENGSACIDHHSGL